MDINLDLENTPLQIKTDSEVGSNEEVYVWFYSVEGHLAGGVSLYFSSPPQYYLHDCSKSRTNFPTDLPSETDKVWTITKSKIQVIIYCNDKEVANVVMSDSYVMCSEISWWRDYWSRDVDKINFNSDDTASDYYRPGTLNILYNCSV